MRMGRFKKGHILDHKGGRIKRRMKFRRQERMAPAAMGMSQLIFALREGRSAAPAQGLWSWGSIGV